MAYEQPEVAQVRKDVDTVAEAFARHLADLDMRFEGIRTDLEVALLEQNALLVRRIERLEALIAAHVGDDMTQALLDHLATSRPVH